MPSTSVKSVRIAAWLLVLTLLSASIDRIADPPAVNPHASQCFAFSLNHSLEAASAQSCQSAGWLQTNQSEPGWVYFALDARTHNPSRRATVIRQAGDPSPPQTNGGASGSTRET